jgi:hypothetical protein
MHSPVTLVRFLLRYLPTPKSDVTYERSLTVLIYTVHKACGRRAKKEEDKKARAILKERNETLNNLNFKDMKSSLQNMANRATRPQGKPLTLEEKEAILRIYDTNKKDFEEMKEPESKVSLRLLVYNWFTDYGHPMKA